MMMMMMMTIDSVSAVHVPIQYTDSLGDANMQVRQPSSGPRTANLCGTLSRKRGCPSRIQQQGRKTPPRDKDWEGFDHVVST